MSKDVNWSEIPFFAGLSPADLNLVKPLFTLESHQAGAAIISENEEGDEMFILVRGRVRVSKSMIQKDIAVIIPGLEHTRKVLATLDATNYPVFGEVAMLDRDRRSATVEAVTACLMLKTSRDRFFAFTKEQPALGCRILSEIGKRLAAMVRRNNSELVKLTTALAVALSRRM